MRCWPLLTVLSLSFSSGPGSAQIADPGDLGIYFDRAGTLTGASIAVGVPFSYFVIATEPPGGIQGYEFGVEHDPRVVVVQTILNPPNAIFIGLAPTDIIAGTGGVCLDSLSQGTTQIVLVEFVAVLFAPADDLVFCLMPSVPSDFIPPAPGYLTCASADDLRTFRAAYEGCAVGNALVEELPVGMNPHSWGMVKAGYAIGGS